VNHMMKKMLTMVIVCAMMGLQFAPAAYAQTSAAGPSGTSTAIVPSFLEFSLARVVRMDPLVDTDPWNDGTIMTSPSFNFGTLVPVRDANNAILYMRGQYYYYVLLLASTSGRRYRINQTGTQLTGTGSSTLSRNSVFLVPDYQWQDQLGTSDQGAPPNGAVLGSVASACQTNTQVYQSGSTGDSRIVRAIIAIGGPLAGENYPTNYSLGHDGATTQGTKNEMTSWVPVTPAQASGTYTGTVTFTLVLN
jgi:hypothetical protein